MKTIFPFLLLIPAMIGAQASLVIGDETDSNLSIDANFVQAWNGGSQSTLYLNLDGGDVRIGQQGGYIRYDRLLEATGIGTQWPEARLHIFGNNDAGLSSNGLVMIGNGVTSSNIIIDDNEIMARNNGSGSSLFFNHDGGNVEFFGNGPGDFIVNDLSFGDHGNMQYQSSTGKFFYDNSSRRYKENITTLQDDWSKILQTRPVTYTRPDNPDRWEYGYVAEEIDSIGLTTMVGYDSGGKPEDVRYDKMIIYLVEVLKIQEEKINALQEQVNIQEERSDALKEQINMPRRKRKRK